MPAVHGSDPLPVADLVKKGFPSASTLRLKGVLFQVTCLATEAFKELRSECDSVNRCPLRCSKTAGWM